MDPLPVVDGRFRLVAEAGRGGMGIVYLARDLDRDRPVALKLFESGSGADYRRFEREIEALAVIDHPRVVRAIAHGRAGDGRPYVVMEWLEGEDLATRLRCGPLSAADALRLGLRVGEALGAAHGHGIIHRDVKPSNIFLVGGAIDDVRLIDFGIARPVDPERPLTTTGIVVGTPMYMAPEQARGESGLTPRADVFALGCVLYHCLCGSPPFVAGDEAATLWRVLDGDFQPPSALVATLSPSIDALIARLLAAVPADRPATGDEVASTIASLLSGAELAAPTSTRLGRGERLLQCAVVTGPAPDAPTRLAEAASRAGGALRLLPDGSLFALFGGDAPLSERCRRAEGFARELARELGDVTIAVRTGRDVDALLGSERSPGEGIQLDATSARLLAATFELERDAHGAAVGGEPTLPARPARTLLGRARELSTLQGIAAESAQDGVARAAVVVGPPGIGKSALTREVVWRIGRDDPDTSVLEAHGDPLTASSPLSLLASLLRRALGLREGQPAGEQRAVLAVALTRDLEGGEHASCCEGLAELLGIGPPPGHSERLDAAHRDALLMNDLMLSAWLTWIEARLARSPVAIVVDDLHWVDLPSLRFLGRALTAFAERPLCVLATSRPGSEERWSLLGSSPPPEAIELEPLSPRPAAELARRLLGPEAPADAAAEIASTAAGNPLHIAELARHRGAGPMPLSDDLLATIEARLTQLPAATRRVLRAASVLGSRFWTGAVAAILGEPASAVETALDELRAEELVTSTDGSRVPGEREHCIVHPLTREAAYLTLRAEDRALAHRLAARWLADTGWTDPALIAEHHQRGGASAEAVTWYVRAARAALDGQGLTQVIELTERAVACDPGERERGTLELLAAEAHDWRGDLDQALACGRAAASRFDRGGDDWLRAMSLLITAAGQKGDNDAVEATLDEVLDAGSGDAPKRSRLAICAGRAATQLAIAGRKESAARAAAAVETLAAAGELDPIARAWLGRVRAARALEQIHLEAAIEALEGSLAAYQRAGDRRSASLVRVFLGSLHTYVGDFEAAEGALDQATAAAERIGAHYLADWSLYARGKMLTEAGELARARTALEAALDRLAGSPRMVAGARLYLSIGAGRAGDSELSAREARAALEAHRAPSLRAAALAALARAELGLGRIESAAKSAREARAELDRLGGMEELEALVRLAHVECEAAAGHRDTARAALESARARLRELAGRMRDPVRRAGFLERVEHHRRILARHEFE